MLALGLVGSSFLYLFNVGIIDVHHCPLQDRVSLCNSTGCPDLTLQPRIASSTLGFMWYWNWNPVFPKGSAHSLQLSYIPSLGMCFQSIICSIKNIARSQKKTYNSVCYYTTFLIPRCANTPTNQKTVSIHISCSGNSFYQEWRWKEAKMFKMLRFGIIKQENLGEIQGGWLAF